MISCIVIDDEEKARETFGMIVQRYLPEKLKVVATAESVKEGGACHIEIQTEHCFPGY